MLHPKWNNKYMINGGQKEDPHLPGHETNSFDDGRLYNLLAREHTPSNSVGSIRVRVGPQIASLVDHVVGDVAVTFDVR